MNEPEAALIAEQMKHANALLGADVDALRAELAHYRELTDHRLKTLEEAGRDTELRLRSAADGITQFKVWSGLANGGSSLISLLALLKAFFLGN
jgi:hypothetical protein